MSMALSIMEFCYLEIPIWIQQAILIPIGMEMWMIEKTPWVAFLCWDKSFSLDE